MEINSIAANRTTVLCHVINGAIFANIHVSRQATKLRLKGFFFFKWFKAWEAAILHKGKTFRTTDFLF